MTVPNDPRLKQSIRSICLPLNCVVVVIVLVFEEPCRHVKKLTVGIHGLMCIQEHIKALHKMLTWNQTILMRNCNVSQRVAQTLAWWF